MRSTLYGVINLTVVNDNTMSYILALAFIALAYFCYSTNAQFDPATVALITYFEASELFTSGHQAVFQFDPLSNRSWNIYERFGAIYNHLL